MAKYTFPTKEQRLREEKKNIIKIPKTREEAEKNKFIQKRIKLIERFY